MITFLYKIINDKVRYGKGRSDMTERKDISAVNEKRMLDAKEVCMYLSLGRNRGVEFARSIGAERKIGRRSLYDKFVIDRYFDKQAQEV